MKRSIAMFTTLMICTVFLISCSKNTPTAPRLDKPDEGKLLFALDAADNVVTGTVTITKGALTHVLPIAIENHTGSVEFKGIQVGHWQIKVQLFDKEGVEIYSGQGEALVQKNQTTTVTIRVNENSGNLKIIVVIPQLILWNKLGSLTEVQKSVIGPNGIIKGRLGFDRVWFKNGVTNLDDKSNISFDSSVFNGEKGTIEFWFKTKFAVVNGIAQERTRTFHYFFIDRTTSANLMIWPNSYFIFYFDASLVYSGGPGSVLTLKILGDQVPQVYLAWIKASWAANEPHHMAVVFDRAAGFDGSKTLAVFLDGREVASTNRDWGKYYQGTYPFMLCNAPAVYGENYSVSGIYIDNIKIWNYPKTDFGDRFEE